MRSKAIVVASDPYSPASPDYALRTAPREVEIIGFDPGTVRIDVGAEATAPIPPAVPAEPAVAPAEVLRAPAGEPVEPDLKPGLGKHRKP